MKDSKGAQICLEPERAGDIKGFPVYRIGGLDVLVLTKRTASLWAPLNQEEYLKSEIRIQEAELGTTMPVASSTDTYKKWLSEKSQRKKQVQETYLSLKKTSPKGAEEFLKTSEKLETDMTEFYRKESEKKPSGLFKPGLTPLDRLERHRQVLADMSSDDRKKQARYFKNYSDPLAPYLASPDSTEGTPLVVQNPDFFDRKMNRTAIQLFAVTFPEKKFADDMINNPETSSGALPTLVLQRYVKDETDWQAIFDKVIK